MFQYDKLPEDAKRYFDALPQYMKENIFQCGVTLKNKNDLSAYCKNLNDQGL